MESRLLENPLDCSVVRLDNRGFPGAVIVLIE